MSPLHTILAGAAVCAAGGLYFATRRHALAEHMRPIYIQRGILPMPPEEKMA